MTNEKLEATRLQTRQFGEHYDYDVTFMNEILEASPRGFAQFRGVIEMSGLREVLPPEVSFVAKIGAYAVVDCGPCLELSLKMGREAGVSDAILRAARLNGEGLPPELARVRDYAALIAAGSTPPEEERAALRERYGAQGLVEIALNVASTLVFPALKRALGHAQSCALTKFSM